MQRESDYEPLSLRGLCSTCRSAAGCTYRQATQTPVIECLEFDGESREESPRPALSRAGREGTDDREPGLCGWCDNRASCTFPRVDGGTWFCEEYQ